MADTGAGGIISVPPSPPFPFGSCLFPVAEGCREAEEHPRMIPKPAACRKRVGLGLAAVG